MGAPMRMATLQLGSEERPRVGLWFGLLLLFVPIFAPLLFFKPYSWFARIGWCGWLGFVVFVKLSGLSEPVIDLSELGQQVKIHEEQQAPQDRSAKGTFVQSAKDQPAPPKLEAYLRELGGGVLGRRIAAYHVDGDTITLRFEETDWFLPNEGRVVEESIGAALSLFYGRDFTHVVLNFDLKGRPLRVDVTRDTFQRFFHMSAAQIRATLTGEQAQEQSPFTAEHLTPEVRQGFFDTFAKYQ